MSLLELNCVTLTIDGTRILDGVDLELWEGYVHAVVGPNGAGKSTLAFTVMGLDGYRDFEGDVRFGGESIKALAVDERARRGMTLGWQEPARYEGLTVERFVGLAARGESDGAAEALEKVGLEPGRYLSRAVDETLSGGERKKVELASILAMRPRLVLLDEPDSGIDVESLQRMREAIGYLREGGSTVLLITHSLEVLGWAEHAFLMCCGRILDKGRTEKIEPYFRDRCIPCDHKNRPDLSREPIG